MMGDLETKWSHLVRRIGSPNAAEDTSLLRDLEEVQHALQQRLFGGRPVVEDSYRVTPDDRRLAILLDALEALSLLEPNDSSYPWDQALILKVTGRSLEAARAYLEAASRFQAKAVAETGVTGDEAEWAQTALAMAARSLISGGQAASAAALLPRLDQKDRAELEPLVAAAAVA